MSESTASTVSNLRQYRFKKTTNSSNGYSTANSATSNLLLIPGRKRIHVPADSSSDEGSQKQKPQQALSVKEKESRLIAVKAAEPDYDTMVCQDALVRAKWDVDDALKYLLEHCTKKRRIDTSNFRTNIKPIEPDNKLPPATAAKNGTSSHQNGYHTEKKNVVSKKIKKKSRDSEDSDCDSERPQEKVFDSDDEDSDNDVMYDMTKDRKNVFEFMNKAIVSELLAVRKCSTKKVDAIMELRPFKDWGDLINKIQNHKNLSTDLLNACQDFLTRRNSMVTIMKKCNKLVQRLESAVAAGGGLLEQPSNLNSEYKLADYQLVGLNWLAVMNKEGMNGILADEMGLGKTIQVISFLAYLKETGQATHPHLVVVPSSTLDNWMLEFAKWCPDLIIEKYYGTAEERKTLRIYWAKSGWEGVDVILATYNSVGMAPEERKMFRVMKLHYVIFDEAHMLKNMTTQRYTNLFRINAARRLLLTGTPLQNNLLELMSLLCFVMPSMFASKTEDIKSLFQKNKQMKEDEVSSFEQAQINQAKKIMQPFVLRRLKKDVLNELPNKTAYTINVPLSISQKEKYKEMVQCHSSETGIVKASHENSGISIMMDMRKLANHPLLLRYHYTDDVVHVVAKRLSKNPLYKKNPHPQYIFEELAILSDFQLFQTMERYNINDLNIPDKLILDSGKCKELDVLLPKLKADGHRVLIFSQFTMMLDILERYLDIKEYGFLRIDGQTPVTERQDLIDQYMTDPELFVFLLSTKAGGLGINLTAADTVIIHDIDFNPYNDKQAEDRCHRMGQKKPVTIYRLVSEGTIEEGMQIVAQEKLNLEKEVTNKDENGVKEHKCMIRLLTMALGMNEEKAESILSPESMKNMQLLKNDEQFVDD